MLRYMSNNYEYILDNSKQYNNILILNFPRLLVYFFMNYSLANQQVIPFEYD